MKRPNSKAAVTLAVFASLSLLPVSQATADTIMFSDSVALQPTNFNSSGPSLYDIWLAPWLGSRVPLERHGGKRVGGSWQNAKINVVFCDGHAETVLLGNFRQVRVSPW